MRTLADALSWWPLIEDQTSLADLRSAIKNSHDRAINNGLRSVCWKAFLLFEDCDRSRWSNKLKRSREVYTSLRSVFLRAIENPDELDDPLSESDNSSWINLRKDEELRREIYQDVDRCMPDNFYFRQPTTQDVLLDILFVWSKMNPQISYRQGMHEVLAPILWVVERDAIDPGSVRKPTSVVDKALVEDMLNADYVPHDTFTLFSLIMQQVKSSYQPQNGPEPTISASSPARTESPMVLRSKRIFEILLAKTDPELASHLTAIGVIPQLFLMRWIRLLFGREFSFDEVLSMWDRMFAEDHSAECVDLICLAMILRIRWQLIDGDNNSALLLLLHYPTPPEDQPPFTLVDDALYLKNHLSVEGGHYLTFKYTNKSPSTVSRPNTPSRPQRPYSPLSKTSRLIRQSGGFDKLFQDAAREVYSRGEKWGLNQAMRDAVGEVRKNVQGLQRTGSDSHHSSIMESTETSAHEQLLASLSALNARNKSLAKMLEGAVNDLWQQQKDESDEALRKGKNDEMYTLAIAKVQLVQVYLEDSSLPLPAEETVSVSDTGKDAQSTSEDGGELLFDQDTHSDPPVVTGADSVASDKVQSVGQGRDDEDSNATFSAAVVPGSESAQIDAAALPSNSQAPPEKSNRPPLTQSSFSWILGQDKSESVSPRAAFLSSTSPFTMPGQQQSPDRKAAARASAAFLFGDDDSDRATGSARKGSVSSKGKDKDKSKARKGNESEEEEAFRLGTLKWK